MASQKIQHEAREHALSKVQEELLETLLQPEDDFYPWNPAAPETEAYFAELEREFLGEYKQEEEAIARTSQTFLEQLHQCWTSAELTLTDSLEASLLQRFSQSVPQQWLEAIANQARQVFSNDLSLADQLVNCVQPLLPNWSQEDLLVFARPVAFPMRGKPEPETEGTDGVTQPVEWTELSQIEQARLSLRVAHCALVQLKDELSEPEHP